jgi:hypothetical protein
MIQPACLFSASGTAAQRKRVEFKKSGAAIKIPHFERQFADGLVCFARSDAIQPIQLADFAAFALNRHQVHALVYAAEIAPPTEPIGLMTPSMVMPSDCCGPAGCLP